MPWTIDPRTGLPYNSDAGPSSSILPSYGANNPSDPSTYPSAAPQAMPGSGGNGMTAMIPSGPSMGLPAYTPPPGMSIGGAHGRGQPPGVVQRFFNAINPIGSAEAAETGPPTPAGGFFSSQLNAAQQPSPAAPQPAPTPAAAPAAMPAAAPATARAPLAIDNPENALTAAFTGGYTKPPPNPENAFTAAFTGGPTAVDQQHMPWPGGPPVNPTTQYRQPPTRAPSSVNLGYGVPGVRPPPVQGPIAALAPPRQGPRFTTIPRPNADPGTGGGMLGGVSGPANIGSGYGGARGGGGAPLGTALDLSGLFQHPQPAAAAPAASAPVQIPRTPATRYRTPATQAEPTNFAGQGPYHGTQGPIGKPVAGSFGGSGIVYGPNGTQILNPGRALFGGGPAS